MRSVNDLNGVDLNLLVVLDALLAERHVTRAALRLNKTQPAVSHALARLRVLFDDPILVRRQGGLQPTPRALELAAPLRDALSTLGGLVDDRVFDPGRAKREFRLSMSDYAAEVLLPALTLRIAHAAPDVTLALVSLGRDGARAAIRAGEIDLAIGVYPEGRAEDLRTSPLFDDAFACLADATSGAPASLQAYLSRPHIAVSASPEDNGEVDAALAAQGLTRRVAITLPHWSVAPQLVRGSDLILTAARRSLTPRPDDGLVIARPPMALPTIPLVQAWHVRRDHDQGLRWLRTQIGQSVPADPSA
ncbi:MULTISPECIES: LysR family transcriptional regulator [unclassified Brevundimonas]|uniref:LysR family transcriptional regulator n=1 Tax=unclassified Brevundimonas TaxID=2622653 RepID=UPI002005BE31|nr:MULTISPECIES: LysR family transcriptional regulator [unclassified Brevundimonas]MCK6103782.1 LysR family transcriptional regulator [Brevundimonas sp. EYE_349]